MVGVTVVWSKGWFLTGTLTQSLKPDKDLADPDEVMISWEYDGYSMRRLASLPDLKYEVILKDEDDESVAQQLLDDLIDSLENQI
jgi:hypothetical protein